jgi:hypothetical protein
MDQLDRQSQRRDTVKLPKKGGRFLEWRPDALGRQAPRV